MNKVIASIEKLLTNLFRPQFKVTFYDKSVSETAFRRTIFEAGYYQAVSQIISILNEIEASP